MSVQDLVLRIKRRESPGCAFLYRIAKGVLGFRMPLIRPLASLFYYERSTRHAAWEILTKVFYYEPLLRARCERVGERLTLLGGLPCIEGNLRVSIGNGVCLHGRTSLVANQVHDRPYLEIGDDTFLGYGMVISVGERVRIGSHCYFGAHCWVGDNDGHPLDPGRRRRKEVLTAEEISPVVIEDDVWLGTRVTVLKGITIGQGSVVGSGSVVTRSIPPFSVAAGNPARIIKAVESTLGEEEIR